MDWNNIDLKDGHERSLNMLEPYSFATLLLELECNARNLSRESIKEHFRKAIQARTEEAFEIFETNLDNILIQATQDRHKDAAAMFEVLTLSSNEKTAKIAKDFISKGIVPKGEGAFIDAVMSGNYVLAHIKADEDNAKILTRFI